MADATKTARTVQSSTTNSAGGTTTSSAVDNRTALGAMITGSCVNGGTGPTIGCTMRVEVSTDGSAWYTFSAETAPTTNSLTHHYQPVVLPAETMYYRTVFTGNTGQDVTIAAVAHELTSVE